MIFARFIFGAIIGSFLDVVASRYNPDEFLFSNKVIGGRSKCVSCGVTLRWFELIPFISFIIQLGRCRSCKAKISYEHFFAEVISGCIVVFVPITLHAVARAWYPPTHMVAVELLWTLAFLFLFLITLIDIRLHLIPDEANIAIGAIGVTLAVLGGQAFGPGAGSFLDGYAFLFGIRDSSVMNHLVGLLSGIALFGFLVVITRGRGMGVGDIKLGAALGILFGWPDALISFALAFIIGSLFGLWHIVRRGGGMKSVLPFGPFLALGAASIFFFGEPIMRWYFSWIQL